MGDSGEESCDIVPKHFYGKNGHTLRTKHFVDGKRGKTLEKSRRVNISSSSDPVPVTAVDEFFDWGFACGTQSHYLSHRRPIREQMEGDMVIECLEANAVKKVAEYRRYDAEMLVHYDLPIIGHHLTDLGQALQSQQAHISCSGKKARIIVKDNSNNANWLFYNGKYWDPNYIYLIHEDYTSEYRVILKPVCASFHSQLQCNQVRLGRITSSLYRLAVADFTCTAATNDRHRYLEMDLKESCMLSHIGIRAIDPGWRYLDYFPNYSNEITKQLDEAEQSFAKRFHACCRSRGRVCRRRKKYKRVVVIRESALSWVERYEVHYRDLQTGKWVNLHRSFEGNSNMHDEHISEVELLTRQVRVYPKQWHQHCRFQILAYGRGVESNRGNLTTNEAQDQVETIRYTIHPNQDHRKRPDGAVSGFRDRWGEAKEKAARRRFFQSAMQEDDCYDDVSNGEILRLDSANE